jgi:hypothetical protein
MDIDSSLLGEVCFVIGISTSTAAGFSFAEHWLLQKSDDDLRVESDGVAHGECGNEPRFVYLSTFTRLNLESAISLWNDHKKHGGREVEEAVPPRPPSARTPCAWPSNKRQRFMSDWRRH